MELSVFSYLNIEQSRMVFLWPDTEIGNEYQRFHQDQKMSSGKTAIIMRPINLSEKKLESN